MNVKMENLILHDLGISVDQIKKTSWEKLDKIPRRFWEKPFRPGNMFIVGENVHLAENQEMEKNIVELRNLKRKVIYKLKYLVNYSDIK